MLAWSWELQVRPGVIAAKCLGTQIKGLVDIILDTCVDDRVGVGLAMGIAGEPQRICS